MSEFMDKRNLSLENQIENMIDKVIREDQGDSILKFSDDDDSQKHLKLSPEKKVLKQVIDQNNLTNSQQPQQQQQYQPQYQRANKKHQTISYQSVPQVFINQMQMFDMNPNFYQQPPLNNYPIGNNPFFSTNNNNINHNSNVYNNYPNMQRMNILKQGQIPNHIPIAYPINSNPFYPPPMELTNAPKFFTVNMGHETPLSMQMKPNRENQRKKFCTTVIPQSTNMKIEMLLYEMGIAMSKTEKIDHYIFNKLQNNFVSIVQTHKGSRIFQNYLKNTHNDIVHLIFTELTPSLTILMKNSYGNYFCKKFFNYLNQKDKIDFLIQIKDSLYELSIHSIGTYPVQGIIDQIGSKVEKSIIISGLKDKISELSYDTYGTHVLEKILSCFEEEFIGFIVEFALSNFLTLAYHHNGICLIKTILAQKHSKDLRDSLKKIIIENSNDLIQHSCGNYVIQVIVECWDDRELKDILHQFKGQYVFLSLQKYSSNVVERCIEKSDETLDEYINEICNSQRISEVMKSNFGNYVIQKALKIVKSELKTTLVDNIMDNVHKLEDKKLIHKWSTIVASHIEHNNQHQQELYQKINELI